MFKILLGGVILAAVSCEVGCETSIIDGEVLSRSRRQLLFPNATLLQCNIGVGTPTPVKTIQVNWALQLNFMLPWNRSQIPVDILGAASGYVGESRRKRNVVDAYKGYYDGDAKMYHFYKYVEEFLNGLGHNGSACVLQALCQIGAEPLYSDDEEDLLYELASFILNPKKDAAHSSSEETIPYVAAYEKGERGEQCIGSFGFCSISLVEMFTIAQEWS